MDIKQQNRILLFSTGQDSFILKKVLQFKDEECLFVNMGTKENEIENKFIDKYFPDVQQATLPLVEFELENKIIPFRNHFLALFGAQYSNNIYFAFTRGDTTKDKDYVFKSQMEGIFNYFGLDHDKIRNTPPFFIHMPYKGATKREMVKDYLLQGYDPEELLTKSCSCYAGKEKPCGICRSCLRKFVSLYLNDIKIEGYFQNNITIPYLTEFLLESKKKGRKEEIFDIEYCLGKLTKWKEK